MISRRELVSFKNAIEFAKVARMHRSDSFGFEHALVVVEVLTGR